VSELSLPQLTANALTVVSLVEHLTAVLPKAEREAASDAITTELMLSWWKGIPGYPRGRATSPTPTDVNFLQILAIVMEHWPRTFSRLDFASD